MGGFWSAGWSESKGKGKGHHKTGHEGPEGEQRYSSALSLTSVLGRVGVQRHAPAALPLGMRPSTHFIGVWVCPSVGLGECGKSRLHWDSIRGPSNP